MRHSSRDHSRRSREVRRRLGRRRCPESLCYSLEGRQFIATRSGIQISADDGPTQIILPVPVPVPDRSRVTGVAIGGPDKDTLFAFCMNKIWKRKIQQHTIGAFTPWAKLTPNKL